MPADPVPFTLPPALFRICLSLVFVLSLVLLIIGIFSPTMTMRKLMVLKHTMSIASGLVSLWKNGQYGLCVLIGVFSIAFPIVKNLLLLYIVLMADWTRMSVYKTINWLERLGRWSMLDVFVVALLIIVVKLRFVAHVEVHSGVYLFTVSVLLTNLVAACVYHMLKR